jgi:tetratricopeptide (TPR) repeat protein
VDGNNAEAHLNLGVAYRGMGQADKAMQEYDAAEKLNPELAAIYLNRAIILHRVKGAPERAIELYRKYVAMAGGDFVLTADAPVFSLLKEAEQMVAAQAEAQRMEAEARKLEAAQAAQQQALKEAEGQGEAAGQVAPANGAGQGSTRPATGAAPSGADSSKGPADPGEPSDEPSDEPSELP